MKKINGDNLSAVEYGIIEKLFPKYGFIKCLSKHSTDKRLFFHCSAISEQQRDQLQIRDYVTFSKEVVNGKVMAKDVCIKYIELLDGVIVRMPKKAEKGSISYKYNDECFFLSFCKEDIMEDSKVKAKDEVIFEKVEKDGGIYSATNIQKKYSKQIRVQGIVTSVKEKFGFIDRSDIVKEIYFNLSALPKDATVVPGVELEFNVKHLRNGKEEAVNLKVLPEGSVRFADIIDTLLYGTLLRSPDGRRLSSGDSLAGNISYVYGGDGKVLQIPFGERDKKYPYSLAPGDVVSFKIAIDRRDQLQRACDVELCLESFPSRKETRHLGVIKMFDGSAGLIEPDLPARPEEDMLVAFKAKEWLMPNDDLRKFLMVSYTPCQVSKVVGNQSKVTTTAIRIMPVKSNEKMNHLKLYPSGSLHGTVQTASRMPDDLGIIICQFPGNSTRRSVAFTNEDMLPGQNVKQGDEVSFGCLDRIVRQYLPPAAFDIGLKSDSATIVDKQRTTVNNHHGRKVSDNKRKIRARTLPDNKIPLTMADKLLPMHQTDFEQIDNCPISIKTMRGTVVILKENFGFVETECHTELYKFGPDLARYHNLNVGVVVEFVPSLSSTSIDGRRRRVIDSISGIVAMVSRGDDDDDEDEDVCMDNNIPLQYYVGDVVQPLIISESDDRYCGIIRRRDNGEHYSFSLSSLVSLKTKLSIGDKVIFTINSPSNETPKGTNYQWINNVQPIRQIAHVIAIDDSTAIIQLDTDFVPNKFHIDLSMLSCPAPITIDDMLQIEFAIDQLTGHIVVATAKLHQRQLIPDTSSINTTTTTTTVSGRKVFKPIVDKPQMTMQHRRGPRNPVSDSIGFTDELKRVPVIITS